MGPPRWTCCRRDSEARLGPGNPLADLVHLLGLVLLLGGIGIADLRLIALFPALPRAALLRALTPVAIAGLALLALSGPILFAAAAPALAVSTTFRWKLALIALAQLDALAFRLLRPGGSETPSPIERPLAALSLGLWLTVAALGRLIAYY